MEIPNYFHKIYSHDSIQMRSRELGAQINEWAHEVWKGTQKDVLAIPVLRGGIFFFADLVRAVPSSMEIVPAQSWGYAVGINGEQESSVSVQVEQVPADGRAILLIDDICDSGRTLQALTAALKEKGAHEVRSAVLIHRMLDDQKFTPDWIGFAYEGPEWFVGYGMEDAERWRNLPDIYTIEHEYECE